MLIKSIVEQHYKNRPDVILEFSDSGSVYLLVRDPQSTEPFIHGNTFYPVDETGEPNTMNQYSCAEDLIGLIDQEVELAHRIRDWNSDTV